MSQQSTEKEVKVKNNNDTNDNYEIITKYK